jgi:hypothetical protein
LVGAVAFALVLAGDEELFEEPPHAASTMLAKATRRIPAAVRVRLGLLLMS